MSLGYRVCKRGIDVFASAAGLATTAPLLVGVAAAVKLDSPGPVLFGHRRVGKHGRPFTMWKFRTMVDDAGGGGPSVTAAGDPRVTRVGRVLRLTKLDELPQLWNVLKGEMSLVGPRPEAQKYVEQFAADYEQILSVPPGITDEASIRFRSEETVLGAATDPEALYVEQVLPHKIALYLDYVRRPSLRRDVDILARTLWKVVSP